MRPNIEAILARTQAATPSPWDQAIGRDDEFCSYHYDAISGVIAQFRKQEDLDFANEAREDVPVLCDYILKLEAGLKKAREFAMDCSDEDRLRTRAVLMGPRAMLGVVGEARGALKHINEALGIAQPPTCECGNLLPSGRDLCLLCQSMKNLESD